MGFIPDYRTRRIATSFRKYEDPIRASIIDKNQPNFYLILNESLGHPSGR